MFEVVKEVIEKNISPILAMDGSSIELVSVEDSTVNVEWCMCDMSNEPIHTFILQCILLGVNDMPNIKEDRL